MSNWANLNYALAQFGQKYFQLLSDSNSNHYQKPNTTTKPHHAPFSLKIGPIMSYFLQSLRMGIGNPKCNGSGIDLGEG